MVSLPRSAPRASRSDSAVTPPRFALYARVSSDEQAERGNAQTQHDFLARYADLYDLPVAVVYLDDGVSGTLKLADRPEGRRLLADAAAGRFSVVLVYKVDRLGRSLAVLLDAHAQLEACGVAIRSATEPFDGATAMGRFMFQLLSSMAELDKASFLERATLGRDRRVRHGKWWGVLPFGYDVGADGQLVPSGRLVPGLGCTEAELIADVFARIADGSTLYAECQRLNALGLVPVQRYPSGKTVQATDAWRPARLCDTIHNPVYMGHHVLHSKHGDVARAVPALVSRDVWERAQRVLVSNRKLSHAATAHPYLLRGRVGCARCGGAYTGAAVGRRRRDGTTHTSRYYRCNRDFVVGAPPCPAKAVNADQLEAAVWAQCAAFIRGPGPALDEARAQLRARQGQAADHSAERARLVQVLAEKDSERDKVMTLFRRNLVTLDEAERQLAATAREQADARALLDALDSADALTAAAESQLAEAGAMLARLRGRLAEIETTDDWATKRAVVELLVREVRVQTTGEGREKRAEVAACFVFGPDRAAVSANSLVTAEQLSKLSGACGATSGDHAWVHHRLAERAVRPWRLRRLCSLNATSPLSPPDRPGT